MTREEALQALRTGSVAERRQAARLLAELALPGDARALENARAREPDTYVSVTLADVLAQLAGANSQAESVAESVMDDQRLAADAEARAVERTTAMLVHELSRFVGFTRSAARDEIPDFDESETATELVRVESLLDAIERLGKAAATPRLEELDLGGLAMDIASREASRFRTAVETSGPQPMLIASDADLIGLAIGACLVNALEATDDQHPEVEKPPSVIVGWGMTDRDYWVALLDQGAGISSALRNPFKFAGTTKSGHLGVGLALAERALRTLGGGVDLGNRDDGGARCELRWPRTDSQ
jgi:signal transduction histidine kinase